MKRLFLVIIVTLSLCPSLHASIAAVRTIACKGTNQNGTTTTGVDTTGANLIVLAASWDFHSSLPTVSDSKSNTWTALSISSQDPTRSVLLYSVNPTVGAAHTFTIAGTAYASLCGYAFSGVKTTSPFSAEDGAHAGDGSTIHTVTLSGNFTPAANNMLVITSHATSSASAPTVGSSMTFQSIGLSAGNYYGNGIGYIIQTTATAINPVWDWTDVTTVGSMRIASFAVAPAAPASSQNSSGMLTGVGR